MSEWIPVVIGLTLLGYVFGYLSEWFPIATRLVATFIVALMFMAGEFWLGPVEISVDSDPRAAWWPWLGLVVGFYLGQWHRRHEQRTRETAHVR